MAMLCGMTSVMPLFCICDKLGLYLPLPPNCDILIKRGYILSADNAKGMGSAYKEKKHMSTLSITPDDMRFESIADFKWSLECGGEIVFEWNDNSFGAFKYMRKTPDSPEQFLIGPSDSTSKQYPEKYEDYYADTVDEILEYEIDGDKLRDIVTKITVTWRTL